MKTITAYEKAANKLKKTKKLNSEREKAIERRMKMFLIVRIELCKQHEK